MPNDILNNPFKKNIFGLLLVLMCFGLIRFIEPQTKKPDLALTPQDTTIHFNEHLVKAISFGQYRLASSILWAETMLRAGVKHYSAGDLNNWMYRRLNLITTLDPYFYQAYLYGGVYLSVVKDDDIGAKLIYERGLKHYPNDLYLCLNSGFHYHFELFDYPSAINVYKRIVNHPNVPKHIPSLLARLQSEEGDLKDAFLTLSAMYDTLPEIEAVRNRFKNQLYAIKAELDLNCLNNSSRESACERFDYFQVPYIEKNGVWSAQKEWKPYRLKNKKKKSPSKEGPSSRI